MPSGRLFIYGTLADQELQKKILGRSFAMQPASITGFRCRVGLWSYLVPEAYGRVEGWILSDLTDADLAKLDVYEEIEKDGTDENRGLYRRDKVVAKPQGDGTLMCWVYVPKLENWDAEWLEK